MKWVRRHGGSPRVLFAATFLLYFAVFLGICLEGPDQDPAFFPFSLDSTAANLIASFGPSDPGSYAKAGLLISQHGWVPSDHQWIINLWPPGMPVVHGALIALFGEQTRVVLGIGVLNCVLWALTFACMVIFLRPYLSLAAALFSPFILLASSLFRDFLLRNSLVYSEGLSSSTWTLSLLLTCLAAQRRSMRLAVLGGLSLACSAYVRGVYVGLAGILAAYVVLVLGVWAVRHRPRSLAEFRTALRGSPALYVLVVAVAFQAFTLPFRIYNYQRRGSFDWLQLEYVWSLQWKTGERLFKEGAGWVVEGGGGMACRVDPEQCKEIEQREMATPAPYSSYGWLKFSEFQSRAVKTFLKRPFTWLRYKSEVFPAYWFSHHDVILSLNGRREYLQNSAYLAVSLLVIALALRDLFKGRADALTLCAGALIITHALIFVMVHFEARYMFPLKMGSVFITFLWAARAMPALARRLADAPTPAEQPPVPAGLAASEASRAA
jgi:hypothetical protein